MQAVVDATGANSNMRPLDRTPLYTLPLVDTTIIEYTVSQLIELGVDKIEVRTTDSPVRRAFGAEDDNDTVEYDGAKISFPHSNHGLAHTLDDGENFLLLKGHVLYETDGMKEMVDDGPSCGYHERVSLGTQGEVFVEDGDVIRMEVGQQPSTGMFGAYAFQLPAEAQDWHESFNEYARKFCNEHDPEAILFEGWDQIRDPGDLHRANMRIVRDEYDGIHIGDDVEIDDDAVVKSPSVLVGDNEVGPGAVVESTVMRDGATIGPQSYVGYSFIGEDSVIEAGVHTVTERTSGTNVRLRYANNERVGTSVPYFGTVTGRRSRIRTGVTLTEGRVVRSGNTVDAGETY